MEATAPHSVVSGGKQKWADLRWWAGLLLGVGAGLFFWFGPRLAALSVAGQHGLALMVMTVFFWVFRVADEAVAGLLFIVAVIGLKVMPSADLLVDWTGPNMWFAISAFILGAAVYEAGMIRRLCYHLLLRVPNSFAGLTVTVFVIQALFTFMGVAGSFARVALLYPLMLEIAQASGLSREGKAFKGLAIAVMASGEPVMLLSYTGFWLNPLAMKLSGSSSFYYSDWLRLFAVPALGLAVATWLVVWLMYRSDEALTIPRQELKERLTQMGPLWQNRRELRAVLYFLGILALWLTDSYHHVDPGWIAVLGACLFMFPRIGVIDLMTGMKSVKWPIVLFLGAAFGLGKMVQALGINRWLGRIFLPSSAPHSVILLVLIVSFVSVVLHLMTGDVASAMSVTIPTIAGYAKALGFNPLVFGFISYVNCWEQYLFPFQNAGVLMAYGYGYFSAKDILKVGLALTIAVPLSLLVIALPYWSLLGVLR
ncbi:MAG: SLC13 family permease [Mycobacterium leprae]